MGRWFSKGRESEVRQHGLIDVVDRSRSLRQHKHIDVGQNELETTRLVQPGGGEEKRDYSELVNEILAPRRYQLLAASTCGLGIAAGSTTVMAIALALPKVEEEFDASDSERSLVASCIFLGMLIGGLVSGILGDHMYGRKSCIVGFTVVIALFGSLTSIAKTINQVASFRFLAGLGIGGESFNNFGFFFVFLWSFLKLNPLLLYVFFFLFRREHSSNFFVHGGDDELECEGEIHDVRCFSLDVWVCDCLFSRLDHYSSRRFSSSLSSGRVAALLFDLHGTSTALLHLGVLCAGGEPLLPD